SKAHRLPDSILSLCCNGCSLSAALPSVSGKACGSSASASAFTASGLPTTVDLLEWHRGWRICGEGPCAGDHWPNPRRQHQPRCLEHQPGRGRGGISRKLNAEIRNKPKRLLCRLGCH